MVHVLSKSFVSRVGDQPLCPYAWTRGEGRPMLPLLLNFTSIIALLSFVYLCVCGVLRDEAAQLAQSGWLCRWKISGYAYLVQGSSRVIWPYWTVSHKTVWLRINWRSHHPCFRTVWHDVFLSSSRTQTKVQNDRKAPHCHQRSLLLCHGALKGWRPEFIHRQLWAVKTES